MCEEEHFFGNCGVISSKTKLLSLSLVRIITVITCFVLFVFWTQSGFCPTLFFHRLLLRLTVCYFYLFGRHRALILKGLSGQATPGSFCFFTCQCSDTVRPSILGSLISFDNTLSFFPKKSFLLLFPSSVYLRKSSKTVSESQDNKI